MRTAETGKRVKIVIKREVKFVLHPEEAASLIEMYPGRFTAHGSYRRLMQLSDNAPAQRLWIPEWQNCWRTGGAACLGPSLEWLRTRESNGVAQRR